MQTASSNVQLARAVVACVISKSHSGVGGSGAPAWLRCGAWTSAFARLIPHPQPAQIMGVHMVGPDAPEITQGVAIAMKAGATKAHFDSTVGSPWAVKLLCWDVLG